MKVKCKDCGKEFADDIDFTAHATACVPFQPKENESFES